jgi:hypothetical protein
MPLKSIESGRDLRAAMAQWKRLFSEGATPINGMGGTIFWHDALEIWGFFGETDGKGGVRRSWNPFGRKPYAFRNNMIVEINTPPDGFDLNIQGAFATDAKGIRWLLHQGRMSVSGSRVTEADFVRTTGLVPEQVRFSDSSLAPFHKVAPLDVSTAALQAGIATFVTHCTTARLAKTAPAKLISALGDVQDWERGLHPETAGSFEVCARGPVTGHRRHGKVWQALAAELEQRGIAHSNDRAAGYGPDMFTYDGTRILFEIKSGATPREIFEATGQLHIYELLLGASYQKVLVAPKGMTGTLAGKLAELRIRIVEYEFVKNGVSFDQTALNVCLAG